MTSALWPVCGHERSVSLLAKELRDDRLRHAYLISGPRSSGKSTIAKAFSAAIICSSRNAHGAACGECDDCRRIEKGIHPDFQCFSLEWQRQNGKDRTAVDRLSVETVREVRTSAAYMPFTAPKRVIVLGDAETLTDVAQEALLKTLEEPPPYLILILLSESAEALKPTIRSRCEIVNLAPVPASIIAQCLIDRGIEDAAAQSIAMQSFGLPGSAITMSMEASVMAGRREAFERAASWVAASPFQRIVRSFELAGDFGTQRERVFSELAAVSILWRSVMMISAGCQTPAIDALAGELTRQRFGAVELQESLKALESVVTCMNDLESNVRPRLALEAMVMKWPQNTFTVSP